MRKVILTLGVAVFGLVSFATSASAQESPVSATPDRISDVDGTWVSGHTGAIRAMVWDFEELNGKMYIGGKFTEVVSPNRETRVPQSFLAAFDVETGNWDSSFTPDLDGAVYAIDVRSDGQLIVAGEVTGGIAIVDPDTGALDTNFDPGIVNSWGRPAVFDIDVLGDEIYAGGSFSDSQGIELRRLAKVNAFTGDIDPNWTPKTNFDDVTARIGGELVWGLEIDAARDRVYLAGKFGGINDNMDAAFFAIVDTVNGELRNDLRQGMPDGVLSHRLGERGFSMWQHDIQIRGDKVYLGGQAHQTLIMDAETLTPYKSFFTNRGVGDENGGGDTQVMFLGKNTLWAGCHCWGSVGEYQLGSYISMDQQMDYDIYRTFILDFRDVDPFGQQKVRGLYGIDLETETLLPITFDLLGQGGGWAMYEDSLGQVWAGGQFTKGGGATRTGLVRFSPPAGDVNAQVQSCEVQFTGDSVNVTWESDAEPESFIVRRTVNNGVAYWRGKVTDGSNSFTDSNRSGVLKYFVETKTDDVVGDSVECGLPDPDVPAEPTPPGLTTTRIEKFKVVVHWAEAGDIEIERDGVVIGTDGDRWYTDSGLEPGTTYTYRIRYQGSQAWSDPITVTTDGGVPVNETAAPSCSVSFANGEVAVTWSTVPGATDVIIQREVNSSGTWYWRAKQPAGDLAFTDSDRDADLEYRIKARYANGDSEYNTCTEN